jgi:hypothetical protein
MSPFVRHFSDVVFFPTDEGKTQFAPFGIGSRLYEIPDEVTSDQLARRYASVQATMVGLSLVAWTAVFVGGASVGNPLVVFEPAPFFAMFGGWVVVRLLVLRLAFHRRLRRLNHGKRLSIRNSAARLAECISAPGLVFMMAGMTFCAFFGLAVVIVKSPTVGLCMTSVGLLGAVHTAYACWIQNRGLETNEGSTGLLIESDNQAPD